MRGPMEIALDEVVRRALDLAALPPGGEVEWMRQHHLGEFRIDLRALAGVEWPDASHAEPVLAALLAQPEIVSARFVAPRVAFSVPLALLRDVVLGAVREAGPAYGLWSGGRGRSVAVTFSDPNANKPLHVGHLRNNVLGIAVSRLLENDGWTVRRSELFSDWGLHICRALLGYLMWGDGASPESAGVPGDAFVGDFYVRFHRESTKQARGARSALPGPMLEDQAADLLGRLERGEEPELAALKQQLTTWVEQGLDETYERIGCRFEGRFRESANLRESGGLVARGLEAGVCRRRPDGSVFIDLSANGFTDYSELTLLRPDGTQLVYTRAFGALLERHRTHPADRVVEVLGSDWTVAYAAFLEALAQLGEEWARDVEMVLHGMVRVPSGRMKSREGVAVGARDLLDATARGIPSRWPLPWPTVAGDEVDAVADALGVGLVKYHLLAVPRDREIVFDAEHLWDVVFPRFAAVLRTFAAANAAPVDDALPDVPVTAKPAEALRRLLHCLEAFPRVSAMATRDLEPSLVVRYVDDLCEAARRAARSGDLGFARQAVAVVLRRSLWLLGIDLPPVELWTAAREDIETYDVPRTLITTTEGAAR